jgi:putative FmdB family regulatory protein
MPLYEYECETCAHRFERIQKFSDPLVANCPRCDGSVHKLVSSPAIQFKGTGWYVTDYAGKGKADPSASESGPSSEAKTKEEKTTPDGTKKASPSTTESPPSSSSATSSTE